MSVPTRRALSRAALTGMLAFTIAACASDGDSPDFTLRVPGQKVLVIGHRGASALRPEHTLAAYRKAIEDGADIIEPDLVPTRDGHLVARHESWIDETTNVASVARFADRRRTKTIDGVQYTGWFTEDFTLAELKELRARERVPLDRPANTQFDDQFEVPTLQEIIALAREMSASTGRTIGIYPETKHPTYFQSIGLPLEERLVSILKADDFTANRTTVWIQSFETANLKAMRATIGQSQPNWRIVQLMSGASSQPWDFVAAGSKRTYGDLSSAAGMREVAAYADGVGPTKSSVIATDANGNFLPATDYVKNAHDAGLLVHPYTFRPENQYLPKPLKTADGARSTRSEAGSIAEIQAYLAAGVDGVFTDDPAIGRKAVDSYKK